MKMCDKLKNILRILVIPWLVGLFIVIGMSNIEQYWNLEFIDWLNVNNSKEYEHKLNLTADNPYRLTIFLQKKEIFDKNILKAESVIYDIDHNMIGRYHYSSTGSGMTGEGVLERTLGHHISELKEDRKYDPYNHCKFIRSTPVFEVNNSGVYIVQTSLNSYPKSWKVGLLLNVKATHKWIYFLIVFVLYAPIFIIFEIYCYVISLMQRVRSNTGHPKKIKKII